MLYYEHARIQWSDKVGTRIRNATVVRSIQYLVLLLNYNKFYLELYNLKKEGIIEIIKRLSGEKLNKN